MLSKLFLQYVLAAIFGVGVDEGYATVYGMPGDPHSGDQVACGGKPVPQDEEICAHRWLPCGTEVIVTNINNPSRTARCRVIDRGPYGVNEGTGRWRGIIDLGPETAATVLGSRVTGRARVRLVYKLPEAGTKTYKNTAWLSPRRRQPVY